MKNKIALGSAQFGLNYGVANAVGCVLPDSVSEIISNARNQGVDTLDTAISYGNSESILGRVGIGDFKVITKLPPLPTLPVNIIQWVNSQVELSLTRLRIKKLDAVLLHRPEDMTGIHTVEYQEALKILKRDNLCLSTGISIYDPLDLERIWIGSNGWMPDIIQAPLNVFDQRLIDSKWLHKLSINGVRVHVRSVFLQGLLLISANKRNSYFEPWERHLDAWIRWCNATETSCVSAALNFVASQSEVEKMVVGVDSIQQFQEILASECTGRKVVWDRFSIKDAGLIDPRRWNLL